MGSVLLYLSWGSSSYHRLSQSFIRQPQQHLNYGSSQPDYHLIAWKVVLLLLLTCTSFASQTQLLPEKMGRFPAPSLQLCCFTDGFSSCLNHGWRKVLLQAPKEGTNHGQVIHSEELCKKEQESGKKVVGYPATFRDSSCKGECLKPNSITGLNCKIPPLFPAAKPY